MYIHSTSVDACLMHINKYLYCILYNTSLNPQNLRNIIKKVAKISINQILIKLFKLFVLMSNFSVERTVFCYFFAAF